MKKKAKMMLLEIGHYVVVYGILCLSWVPMMDFFKDDVMLTAAAGLGVFFVADQLAHKVMLGEKFLWE